MLLGGADRGDFACHRSLSHISSCVIHSFSMTYLQQPPSCSMSKPSHTSSPPRCQHKSDMPAHTASVVMSVHIQNSFHVSNHVQRQSTYFRNPTQASLLQRKITQEILQPDMECGSVGTVEKPGTILIWCKFDSPGQQGIFLPPSTLNADSPSLMVLIEPLGAAAGINVCTHINNDSPKHRQTHHCLNTLKNAHTGRKQ